MKIEEIAKLAGVSPATVSNVLNNRKNVGENTRKRILEICNASGYSQKRKKKLEKYGRKCQNPSTATKMNSLRSVLPA